MKTSTFLARLAALFGMLAFSFLAWAQPAPPSNLNGTALQSWLKSNYYDGKHNTLGYTSARRYLYNYVDNENNQIVGVYSGYVKSWTYGGTGTNPSPINCEHTVPQSFFGSSEPMKSDMHHLYPTYGNWNSTRSNHPFAEINDSSTEKWMINTTGTTSVPTSNIDGYSEYANSQFEPREVHKGNVARSVFYFFTMYPTYDINQVGDPDTFYQWHLQDPVDAEELQRNGEIEQYQGDRNPYIDYPELVARAFGFSGGNPPSGGSCNNASVTLTLVTDNYGSETSWSLTSGSTTIGSGSGYGNNQTITETFCLADGSYTFTINDQYGDGICCSYGNGSYSISNGSTVLASGGQFGSTESKPFTIGGGTPPASCNAPAIPSASSVTASGAAVSWGAVSGASNYTLRYRVSGTSSWTSQSVSGTFRSLTGLAAATSYEVQVRTNCASSSSSYSASRSFTTTSPTPPTAPTYCASKGNNASYEYIDKVSLGSINRTSGNDGGYYDGTALSTNLAAGSTASITVSAGFQSSSYTEYFRVWIDFNRDGDFSDSGEQVFAQTTTAATDLTGSISVPSSAAAGATRMRVSMKYNGVPTACEASFSYGEVEDYTVNITSGGGSGSGASELFISEYVEGSSNNKAIEIANLTGSSVNLSAYELRKQTNGAGSWGTPLALSGNLANGQVFVVANSSSSAALLAKADQTPSSSVLTFNGNDPIGLFKNGALIDVVGNFNGGSTNFAANTTLVRKASVTGPSATYSPAQWNTYPSDTFGYLGNAGSGARTSEVGATPTGTAAALTAFPNPFEHELKVRFSLEKKATVSVAVYNTVGRLVKTVKTGELLAAGMHEATIGGNDLESGLYVVIVAKGNQRETLRIVKR